MTPARNIAYERHAGVRTRAGEPIVAHLERVAAAVPIGARTVAYLHDILEHSDASVRDLEECGVSVRELEAIKLLTRLPGESFEAHTLRIAFADGPGAGLARIVKLADLEDHAAHDAAPNISRPYGWARRHLEAARARFDRPASTLEPAA